MWNLNNNTNELYTKTDSHRHGKQTMITKGERDGERDKLEVWD